MISQQMFEQLKYDELYAMYARCVESARRARIYL